jgi:hypothetical protein
MCGAEPLAAAEYLVNHIHEAPVWIVPCLEGATPTRTQHVLNRWVGILSNFSRLVPGAGSPDRYRGATCSSHARLYKAPTVSLTFGSRITRNRQRCIFPPLGAQTPASKILRISSRSAPHLVSAVASTEWF